MNNRTIIIAEAGVNHNGSIKIAKKLIDAAAKAGADYVKFQTFKASEMVTNYASLAEYQKKNFSKKLKQLELLKSLELSEKDHFILIRYCKKKKIKFLTTAFDDISLKFIKKIKLKVVKIPSGEITNYNYLKTVASFNKKIILSTGMSTIAEIKGALCTLKKYGVKKNKITILHCSTQYPVPKENINMRAMQTIKKLFDTEVGYSDHSTGILVPIVAVAHGASIIEKHLTLDKKMKGPDHSASIEPNEFIEMVKDIRDVEMILGSSQKIPSVDEKKNLLVARKFIVAKEDIKKGDILSVNNITFKRTGTKGISPMDWKKINRIKSNKNYKKDQLIKL